MQIIEALTENGASQDAIRDLEASLGAALSDGYREFVRKTNGGRPDSATFRFQTTGGESDSLVDWFYTLAPDDDYNIRDNIDIFQDRIPSGLIPIGCDPFGNQILLGVNEQAGAVFFWDHELGSEEPTWENVSKVASSFQEFLNMFNGRPE